MSKKIIKTLVISPYPDLTMMAIHSMRNIELRQRGYIFGGHLKTELEGCNYVWM